MHANFQDPRNILLSNRCGSTFHQPLYKVSSEAIARTRGVADHTLKRRGGELQERRRCPVECKNTVFPECAYDICSSKGRQSSERLDQLAVRRRCFGFSDGVRNIVKILCLAFVDDKPVDLIPWEVADLGGSGKR